MQTTKFLVIAVVIILMGSVSTKADYSPQQEQVDEAYHVLARMVQDPDYQNMAALLPKAKGVLIIPTIVRAGFIFGGEYGSGILLVRGGNNSWSYPVFFDVVAGNVGFQAGAQSSETVLLIMRDAGIEYFVDGRKFKLGGNISLAVGPVGAGLGASATGYLNADIYSFARSWGLFGGGSLEGSWVIPDEDWNAAYYGPGATAYSIVYEGHFSNPGAERLRELLEGF